MKNGVVGFVKSAICFFLIASLCGCWNSRELNSLAIVTGVGIDRAEEPEKIKITAQVVRPGEIAQKGNNSGGSTVPAYWNVTHTGNTVFGAIRSLSEESSRRLFFPHEEILIFSNTISEEGVRAYLDFFTRDPEPRNNIWILIAEGTAEEILNVPAKLEKIPSVKISQMVVNHNAITSQSVAVTIDDFITNLLSPTTAPIAPIIGTTGDGEDRTMVMTGTAVFKGDKMVGRLDQMEGRGLLWVQGKIKSGIIEVQDPKGDLVSLEIIRAGSKITPVLQDGKIIMKVEITEEGNIGEYTGSENLSDTSMIAFLEQKKTEAIRDEILAAFEKARELDADIFGFGNVIYQRHPKVWKDMQKNWDELFQEIELEVSIQAKLRLMGRISNPNVPEQG
jgi:spore germination protein KC